MSELAVFLGERTNNYAEWTAVALALEEAKLLGASRVDLRTDSQLVARQISGMYRVKHPDLKPIHAQVMELLAGFDGYTVGHVPRELNKEADRLSNVAIDQRGAGPDPIEFGSLEAAGRPRAHRSKGRVRGKSELHRAGSRVTPVRREARTSATVTMPASAGVKRGKLEPEQDRIGGRRGCSLSPRVGRSDGWPSPGRCKSVRAQNSAYRPPSRDSGHVSRGATPTSSVACRVVR